MKWLIWKAKFRIDLQSNGRKGDRDGGSAGTDCDRCPDFLRPNAYWIWTAGGVAVDDDSPWNRRAFSEQEESGGLDNDDHGNLYPGGKILFHSYFGPSSHQDILSTSSLDRHRPLLALEI